VTGSQTVSAQVAARDRHLEFFEARERAASGEPAWLREIRRAAIDRFAEVGFPTTRDEEWKYTNVAPIVEGDFRPDGDDAAVGPGTEAAAAETLLGDPAWKRLVLVNGRLAPRSSTGLAAGDGLRVLGLADAIGRAPDLVRPHLARQVSAEGHGLSALSTAFIRDGAVVHVAAGRRETAPLHLVSVTRSPRGTTLAQPRLLVVLDAGAEAVLVESHVGVGDEVYWTNVVMEVVLGDGARLDHVRVQAESPRAFHVARLQAHLGHDARLATCAVNLGGRLVRQEIHVTLAEEGTQAAVNGLYLLGDRQHVDTHTVIDHVQPHGTSRQLHKGVLDGQARAIFSGRVIVRPGAQKTDAHQTNKNLLLSDGVEVDSRPQLEIFADDVKCTHGAADGQLAADALFYLRSRGLGEASARALLTYGFAAEVLAEIGVEPVRRRLEARLIERFGVTPPLEETTG
jgi:Fe-S cluster assembly protein SufD